MTNHVAEATGRAGAEWATWKRRAVRGFVVMALFLGVALAFVPEASLAYSVLQFVAWFVMTCLTLLWVIADSLDGDHPVGGLLVGLVIVAPFVGVPAYVLRGRGPRQGGIVLGKIVGFVILLAVIAGVTHLALAHLLSGSGPA